MLHYSDHCLGQPEVPASPASSDASAVRAGDSGAASSLQPVPAGNLTQLDWSVVWIARKDGPWSLNPDGLTARFLRLLAIPVPRKLANEKLEALRRFCVRAWHSDLIRTRDTRAFMEAGYSSGDLLEILAHIAGHRGFTPSLEEESG